MLSKSKILGVNGSRINVQASANVGASYNSGATRVNANLGGFASTGIVGMSSLSVNSFAGSNYQYWMTGLLPADPHLVDTSTLAYFYRDIYFFDNVAGSCVDILSRFPFSKFELRGLEESELEPYQHAIEQLSLEQMMPLIATSQMVDGFFCGSLVFDARTRRFLDTLIHDALSCAVIPSPFFNIDPTINVRVGQATQQFMHDTSEYAKRYLDSMPSQFIDMLRSGAFTLDPVTTLFVPRRSTTDRSYTSYLHRILPMYLIEKTLYRGTLTEAQRRQRAMTHLQIGDADWTPNDQELLAHVEQFQAAEADPLGGWVSTRNAVQAVDLRPGGDFWKWTDMSDLLTPYKLRALGVSEALLSGDASFAAAESAYSTFLETSNSYREDVTQRVFDYKVFPLIAVANNMYKDPRKRADSHNIVDFLFNRNNRANLKMPTLHWDKSLDTKGEENMAELLELADEKGVPIPLKMWMTAAHLDPDNLLRELRGDRELRENLAKYTGKDTSPNREPSEGPGLNSNDFEDESNMGPGNQLDRGRIEQPSRTELKGSQITSQALSRMVTNPVRPLLDRQFAGADNFTLSKTGKIKHVPSAVTAERRTRANDQILKIARLADKDPSYRISLKKANASKLGRTTLSSAPSGRTR